MWVDNWKESLQQVKDNKILQLHTKKTGRIPNPNSDKVTNFLTKNKFGSKKIDKLINICTSLSLKNKT
ncbi:hypothetical protein [uncultured Gammaproteobacteria bacterium]|nr:hypothetical protein [uncultured Gammaproteobacteria bacterium]